MRFNSSGVKVYSIIEIYNSIEDELKSNGAHRRKVQAWPIIAIVILIALGAMFPIGGLLRYILPLLFLWVLAEYFGFINKSKGLSNALVKKKALPLAVKEVLLARGYDARKVEDIYKNFPQGFWHGKEYYNLLEFDNDVELAFHKICNEKGAVITGYTSGEVDKEFL